MSMWAFFAVPTTINTWGRQFPLENLRFQISREMAPIYSVGFYDSTKRRGKRGVVGAFTGEVPFDLFDIQILKDGEEYARIIGCRTIGDIFVAENVRKKDSEEGWIDWDVPTCWEV